MTQDFTMLLQGRVAFRSSRESDQWSQVTEWHGSHFPTAQLDGSLIELSKTREKLRQKYIGITVRQTEEEIEQRECLHVTGVKPRARIKAEKAQQLFFPRTQVQFSSIQMAAHHSLFVTLAPEDSIPLHRRICRQHQCT